MSEINTKTWGKFDEALVKADNTVDFETDSIGAFAFKEHSSNIVENLKSLDGATNGVGTITVGKEGYLIDYRNRLSNNYPYVTTWTREERQTIPTEPNWHCHISSTYANIGRYSPSTSWWRIDFNILQDIKEVSWYETGSFENESSYISKMPSTYNSTLQLLDASGNTIYNTTREDAVSFVLDGWAYRLTDSYVEIKFSNINASNVKTLIIKGGDIFHLRESDSQPHSCYFTPNYLVVK